VVASGLVKGELGVVEFRLHCFDAGLVGYTEQVGVTDGEDDEIAGILGGELGTLEVVLGGHVLLKGSEIEDILAGVSTHIHYLKGSDDRIDSGDLKAVGGEVDLLHGDGGSAGDGGEQGLQAFEAGAVG
jgi:hypothetical protein